MKALRKSVIALATLGPIGALPAPGTWGSAVGVALYALVFQGYDNPAGRLVFFALAVIAAALAIVVCHQAEKYLGKKDPGSVILDEVVAVPLVFIGIGPIINRASHEWAWYLAGFLFFRLFDIAKPFGIRALQKVGGGFGIVVDDLVAALYACGCLHALHYGLGFLR